MPGKSQFSPCWWGRNPHVQTLLPTLIRRNRSISTIKQRWDTEDGDFLDLAWSALPCKALSTPIIVVFHGLEGSIDSPYIKGLFQSIRDCGWIGVLMHFRGCSQEPNRATRSYHSGETTDAAFIIRQIKERYPQSPLFAVGYSLGGNMILKYLGEQGDKCLLDAAVAVSVPFKLDRCAARLETGFSRAYLRHLVRQLTDSMVLKMKVVDFSKQVSLTEKEIINLKTFREFDDVVTAPLHGFENADDYYNRCSSLQFLKNVKTPTLVLHSEDDPFISRDAIPSSHELSAQVKLELSKAGGHVGFISGGSPLKPEFWLEKRIPEFIGEQLTATGETSRESR